MPVTNVRPLNQLLGLNGKSADVIRGYRFGARPERGGQRMKQSIILIFQSAVCYKPQGFDTIAL